MERSHLRHLSRQFSSGWWFFFLSCNFSIVFMSRSLLQRNKVFDLQFGPDMFESWVVHYFKHFKHHPWHLLRWGKYELMVFKGWWCTNPENPDVNRIFAGIRSGMNWITRLLATNYRLLKRSSIKAFFACRKKSTSNLEDSWDNQMKILTSQPSKTVGFWPRCGIMPTDCNPYRRTVLWPHLRGRPVCPLVFTCVPARFLEESTRLSYGFGETGAAQIETRKAICFERHTKSGSASLLRHADTRACNAQFRLGICRLSTAQVQIQISEPSNGVHHSGSSSTDAMTSLLTDLSTR